LNNADESSFSRTPTLTGPMYVDGFGLSEREFELNPHGNSPRFEGAS